VEMLLSVADVKQVRNTLVLTLIAFFECPVNYYSYCNL